MKNVLIIGAGAVGAATTHKCAQNNDVLGNICLASRTVGKCDDIIQSVEEKGSIKDLTYSVKSSQIDAKDKQALVNLIKQTQSSIVLNVTSPYCNLAIIEACLQTGTCYLDTAVYEREGDINIPAPWYANYEWKYCDQFAQQKLSGILGIGFDPGAVNVFCAYAKKHLVEHIDTIDIMDVNGGSHGKYFATNFDAETNLREIMEDVIFWEDGEWQSVPCHSKSRLYDYPELGEHRVYSMGHDEIHSLYKNIPANRIEFWMGFNDHYIGVFSVLNNLGLLSSNAVDVEGTDVIPVKLVKSLLPDPASLAKDYSGSVCIGCLVKGHQKNQRRKVFVFSTCSHEDCYNEIGAQAISYTTAVPLVTAAMLIMTGHWDIGKLVNVEELDPDPFMELMPKVGIDWDYRDDE